MLYILFVYANPNSNLQEGWSLNFRSYFFFFFTTAFFTCIQAIKLVAEVTSVKKNVVYTLALRKFGKQAEHNDLDWSRQFGLAESALVSG